MVRLRFYVVISVVDSGRVLRCGVGAVLVGGAGLGHADEDLGELVQIGAVS